MPSRRCCTTPATWCPGSWSSPRRTGDRGSTPPGCGACASRCRAAATTCCSGCGATATGRRCGPALWRRRSMACGGRTGWWSATSTRTSRARRNAGPWTSRIGTSARTALRDADVVLAVGLPGMGGAHAQLRVVRELVEFGIAGARIVPVVNRAPRGPRPRSELGATLAGPLLAAACPGVALASTPVFVPERRRLDVLVRDGAPLPAQIVRPITGAVRALLDRTPELPPPPVAGPVAVVPGSLGSWSAEDGGADGEPAS